MPGDGVHILLLHVKAYTPGGEEGHRPNRAVTVYGNLIRQTFKDAPIIILVGGKVVPAV